MMYSGDGNEMVHDMINMLRLGWSTSGMFCNPILAALGPEFLFLIQDERTTTRGPVWAALSTN